MHHTLQVYTWIAAVPYFVMMMGHTTVKPVHQATVEKFGDQVDEARTLRR